LHTRLPPAWSQYETLLEQPETGAAKHLALEQFQACDMPLHGPVAPGQGESGFDGVIIVSEPFGKALQGYNGTLRDPGQPGIQLRALTLAYEVGTVLRQRDGLSHFGMLRAPLGELLRFLRVTLLGTPYDQPGRLAGRQQLVVGLGHDREGRPRRPLPRCLALRLAQALRVAGDRGLAATIAALLELAIQAQRLVAAGVPSLQEIRFIGIEDTAAPVTAARALRQGRRAAIAKHRTFADPQMGGNGMARPTLRTQRPHPLMALDPARSALGCLLRSGRWRGWDSDGHGAVSEGHALPA